MKHVCADSPSRRGRATKGSWNVPDLICLSILLCSAFGVRVLYQRESVVNRPLRADAGKYYSAAYNLRTFGVYSETKPRRDRQPPETRTDLSPGYPLFPTLFGEAKTTTEFDKRVIFVQAILGTLTTAFTFLLARMALGLAGAGLAETLTALSPHLIAMNGYLLTESLFTFTTVLGTSIVAYSWRSGSALAALMARILIAVSARVRAVGFALPLALAPVFLLDIQIPRLARTATWARSVIMIALGFVLVCGAHREFVRSTVTHESSLLRVNRTFVPSPREAPRSHVVFPNPWQTLSRAFRPPNFFIKGVSHILRQNKDKSWKLGHDGRFWDHPVAYLKWNLGARLYYIWHWDNAYNGDADIYPMKRRGFRENAILGMVHGVMYILHWPLVCAGTCGSHRSLLALASTCRVGKRGFSRSTDDHIHLFPRCFIVPVLATALYDSRAPVRLHPGGCGVVLDGILVQG